MATPIAYDIGMNNGDNCEYYLKKGYRVIGVEANPFLCEQANKRFEKEVRSGRLTILNLGVGPQSGRLIFYIHKLNSVLSTFSPEQVLRVDAELRSGSGDTWLPIEVDVRRLSDIVRFFGVPGYVKIDVEGFDVITLKDLHENKIYPDYISAEAFEVDTFCLLVTMGYTEFKLVNGADVNLVYADHEIGLLEGGATRHNFPAHSAGPFGEDIPGPWLDKVEILGVWQQHGGGWCDIHARIARSR